MKKLLCLPAMLAIATLSAHAQETPGGNLETDTESQNQTQESAAQSPRANQGAAAELGRAATQAGAGSADLTEDFSAVDKDADGELSIDEAKEAFPAELLVIDSNNDGKLNQSEVESLVPGLMFSEDGSPADQGATVGAEEYERIVQALRGNAERQDTAIRLNAQDPEV